MAFDFFAFINTCLLIGAILLIRYGSYVRGASAKKSLTLLFFMLFVSTFFLLTSVGIIPDFFNAYPNS